MNKMVTNDKMNAIRLHAVGDLRYESVPVPALIPGCVRVRIGFCGVCGSDIPRSYSKGTYSFPTICGHEFAGVVESVADDVSDFQIGDRVAVFPLLWNDEHPACEIGAYSQSEGYDYLGSRSDGGFSEFVVAPARNLIRVPEGVSIEEAAMTEPAAVALHAARRARVRLGDHVAVFGLGPIGIMLAQWLRAMGVAGLYLFDISDAKLELVRSLGFSNAYNSLSEDPCRIIESATQSQGVHVAFEAAGVSQTMVSALQSVRRKGRVVLLGNPSQEVTLPPELISRIMRREAQVLGTWNSSYLEHGDDDDWRATLAAMQSGLLNLKPLISHKVPLSRGISALEMMRDQREFYSKVLIDPNE